MSVTRAGTAALSLRGALLGRATLCGYLRGSCSRRPLLPLRLSLPPSFVLSQPPLIDSPPREKRRIYICTRSPFDPGPGTAVVNRR